MLMAQAASYVVINTLRPAALGLWAYICTYQENHLDLRMLQLLAIIASYS